MESKYPFDQWKCLKIELKKINKIIINYKILMPLIALSISNLPCYAQLPAGIKQAEKIYGGVWTDKKTTRHLQISFGNDQFATITDWTSKYQKKESGDVYKALIKNGKLIMPEDTEHHVSYSEIIAENKILIYRTKVVGNGKALSWDKQVFTRK